MKAFRTARAVARKGLGATTNLNGLPPVPTRSYAIVTATAATVAAASGGALRVFGYNVPWPVIVGGSMAVGVAAYAWETKRLATVDRELLSRELMKTPSLPTGATLTNQDGQKIDVAAAVRGNYALVTFGALHSTDQPVLERMAKVADIVKESTGQSMIPVYVSIDPVHDKASDLKTAAGRSGSKSMLVVTGPPDGLLTCAERYKNMLMARVEAGIKDMERYKKGGLAAGAAGMVSDWVYVVNPEGRFVSLVEKSSGLGAMSDAVTQEVQRSVAGSAA